LWPARDGKAWIAAPTRQQIQVTTILSQALGVDPGKPQQCIDKTFANPANAGKTIREAARQCTEHAP
jgi:hypothetical protein